MARLSKDGESRPAENAGEGVDPLRLDLQLCFALYTASNLVTRLYWPHLQALGLTYLQYLALLALWERSPQTVGELGRRLHLDSGTLTPLFKRLEGMELVTRTRDPQDERRVMIAVTEKARELRREALAVPRAVFSQIPLTLEEMVDLKARLGQLIDGLSSGASGSGRIDGQEDPG